VRFDECFHEVSRLLYYAALRIARGLCADRTPHSGIAVT